jgi:acyl carrier protein
MTKVDLLDVGGLSRPLRLLQRDGFLRSDWTVFDYGCGDGRQVSCLRDAGIPAQGWDPGHNPDAPRLAADIVNLGYVLNVLSSEAEQVRVLQLAWQLARRLLVISVPVRPGNVRSDRSHAWLLQLVEEALGTRGESVGIGILYVFRDDALRREFVGLRSRGANSLQSDGVREPPWKQAQIGAIGRRFVLKGAGAVGLATYAAAPASGQTTAVCIKDHSVVLEKVRRIVVEHLGVSIDKVTENASFIDTLGADSLDTVELVMAFEEEFGVEIADADAARIVTVGQATDYIFRAVSKAC